MPTLPTLHTRRLILRPFAMADAPELHAMCDDPDLASTTLTLPSPYALADAEQWILKHGPDFESGVAMTLALTLRETGVMVGNVGMRLSSQHARGELGYLIGKRYWGCGYCTEGARAAMRYAFAELKLNRIYAEHFTRNPASGRVMLKTGMRCEGILRQHLRKLDGRFEDAVTYGILRAEAAELLGEGIDQA